MQPSKRFRSILPERGHRGSREARLRSAGNISPYRRLAAEVVRQAWLDVLDKGVIAGVWEGARDGDTRAETRLRRHRTAVAFFENLDRTLWGDCLALNRELVLRMVRRKVGDSYGPPPQQSPAVR